MRTVYTLRMKNAETYPWAWGFLAGLCVLLFGVFEACDYPMLSSAASHRPRISASTRGDETAASVMGRQLSMIEAMELDFMVHIDVNWMPCGDENSFYLGRGSVLLCAEMLEHPEAAVQFAAHEAGHAVTDALASETDEGDADEIAALEMARHRLFDDMLGAAMYMWVNWPADHRDGDEHPGGAFRAKQLVCVESAAEALTDPTRPASPECLAWYAGLLVKWSERLGIFLTP